MKIGSDLASSSARQKKCTWSGYDDIAPDRPAVAIMRIAPFVDQYVCNVICSQDRASSECARGHEINGPVDPDALKPTQMLMHCVMCRRQ